MASEVVDRGLLPLIARKQILRRELVGRESDSLRARL